MKVLYASARRMFAAPNDLFDEREKKQDWLAVDAVHRELLFLRPRIFLDTELW
jgi:hypothetical protein